MNFLLINSNENDAFAAVYEGDKLHTVWASEYKKDEIPKPGRSPDKLIHCLASLREKFDFRKIDAISVTAGPGSFTGIRVGISFAKGISAAINKPIIPINSFDLQYFRINGKNSENHYCVLIPAKLPEYYFALYENDRQTITGSGIIDDIVKSCPEKTFFAVNFDNESEKKHSYFKFLNLNKSTLGEADAMLQLTKKYFSENRQVPPGRVEPVYIKELKIKI